MASRGQSITIEYTAWDTSANGYKTGDVANHTLRWIKDGTAAAPTNSPAEVDSVNSPGVYKLTLTAAECTCDAGMLSGKSSTTNVVLSPTLVTFEQLPTAAAGSNGGLPTVNASNQVTGMDTLLARILGTLAAGTHSPQSGDGYAEVTSVTYGLSVIAAYVDELETRLSAARAGYLDKLNITGNVASSGEVTAIQNNTRVRVIVPDALERPDSGTTSYKLWLHIYDTVGNMEAPDSLPTISAENQAGVDRSANLGTVTLSSVGVYYVTYDVASTHEIEQIVFNWSIVEGGATRSHGASTMIVDTTAVDFTAADRTDLQSLLVLLTRLSATRAGYMDNLANLDALVSDIPNNAEFAARTLLASEYFNALTDNVTVGGYAAGQEPNTLVWKDTLTTYVDGEAGRRVKSLTVVPTVEGLVAGTNTTTIFTTDLIGYDNDHFQDQLAIVETGVGTDIWQGKPILSYDGATGQFVVDEPYTFVPLAGARIALRAEHVHPKSQIAASVLTRTATEDYPADGAEMNFAQFMYLVLSFLAERSYSGNQLLAKKLDGVTPAATYTITFDGNGKAVGITRTA